MSEIRCIGDSNAEQLKILRLRRNPQLMVQRGQWQFPAQCQFQISRVIDGKPMAFG